MASNVAGWCAAPGGAEADGDPVRNNNALNGSPDSPSSVVIPAHVVGKHGQTYPDTPDMDGGFCNGSPDGAVPNAVDPNTGSGSGIKTSQFAKG